LSEVSAANAMPSSGSVSNASLYTLLQILSVTSSRKCRYRKHFLEADLTSTTCQSATS
jgi:hypothetical protein